MGLQLMDASQYWDAQQDDLTSSSLSVQPPLQISAEQIVLSYDCVSVCVCVLYIDACSHDSSSYLTANPFIVTWLEL